MTTTTPESSPPEEAHQIPLTGKDCAVVFDTDNNMNVYIQPKLAPGTPITRQMWLVLIVQELFKDQSLMKLLSQRIMDSGGVTTEAPESITGEAAEESPSEEPPAEAS